jgi:hypothetical protein
MAAGRSRRDRAWKTAFSHWSPLALDDASDRNDAAIRLRAARGKVASSDISTDTLKRGGVKVGMPIPDFADPLD